MEEKTKRSKLYLWLYSFKSFNQLKKYGYIHYSSRKMNYVVMYVDEDERDEKIKEIEKLNFVREVDISPQETIDMSFEHALDDWLDRLKEKNENQPINDDRQMNVY